MLEVVTVNGGQVFEQFGKEAKLVITKVVEPASVTWIGYVPGGVAVVPVANIVDIVPGTPAQNMGAHCPPKQLLQSIYAESLYQV